MRTFIAFAIVLCLVGGSWLLQGPAFFWPDRLDPSQGVFLDGLSSQLLGAGLLAIAGIGVMAARQAARGSCRAAPRPRQAPYLLPNPPALWPRRAAPRRWSGDRRSRPSCRWRRRRSALARSDDPACRAHETGGGPPAAPAVDGGNGATGLRTMRIQLSGLFRGALLKTGSAAESLRARRERDRAHAQNAVPGIGQPFAPRGDDARNLQQFPDPHAAPLLIGGTAGGMQAQASSRRPRSGLASKV